VLPVIIIAVIAVPLLIVAVVKTRRRTAAREELAGSGTSQAELEREFAAAEAYDDEWRKQQHSEQQHPPA